MIKKPSVIAKNIKRLRKERGISQDKLSKLADVSFHTITKIEAGNTSNPTVDTVKKIAKVFGVSVDELIK